jgi:hypothetical protein
MWAPIPDDQGNVYLMHKTGDEALDSAVQDVFLATEARLTFPHASIKQKVKVNGNYERS